MFSLVQLSECYPMLPGINHAPSSPEHQIKGYRVSCSRQQHIHPVKRDKSRAGLTAKEHSQNINSTEEQPKGKAMRLLTENSSYFRFPKVDDDIPYCCPVSADTQSSVSLYSTEH